MRLAPLVLLLPLACSSGNEPLQGMGLLETNATSYVATPMSAGAFDYGVSVIVRLRNDGQELIRVSRCLPTTNYPPYFVEKSSNGQVAWNPNLTCSVQGTTLADLRPGEERTDTLNLRAPWLRSFNGQPIGDVEGEFYLIYETQICRAVSTNGQCTPINLLEYPRSNKFRITTQ